VVPTSYAAYVWRWIVDAATQFGLSVDSDGTAAPARAG
jgi:hypothetical protein